MSLNKKFNNMPTAQFEAKRCFLMAEQQLNSTPENIFPLLCPTREYEWIETWKCDLIYSDSGLAELCCIFKTNFPREKEEIWITNLFEPNKLIQFLRVSEKLVIRYTINLSANEKGDTTAIWVQVITALNEEGNQYIEACSNVEFGKNIKGLEKMLNHYLETGKMLRTEVVK